jgi:carbamoyltransferase
MNILIIHLGHDGSVTIIENNKIIIHQQIDRYNKIKHTYSFDFNLFKRIKELNIEFNFVHFTNLRLNEDILRNWVDGLMLFSIINENTKIRVDNNLQLHHVYHSARAVFFAKHNDIDIFVSDGTGALIDNINYERVSVYNYNQSLTNKYKLTNRNIGVGLAYECVCTEYGFKYSEEGKLMALSQYGKFNKSLYDKYKLKNVFNLNNLSFYKEKVLSIKDTDNAYNFQKVCEEITFDLIEKYTSKETVCLTGGVNQNILINTFLSKNIKKQILVDPLGNDQGISFGAAVLHTNFKLECDENIYLGFKPVYDLDIFDSNLFEIVTCNNKHAAEILVNEPIAIFQGCSEQGQRGLGNRSLLMNPIHIDAINKINLIKKREWYRPFACSILHEELNKWFVVDNDRNPHYMMFTFQARDSVKDKLKNVTAIDGSCRLQSVTKKYNQHYYEFIKTFFDLTKIPLVLNTSLNLPGHTLVETLEDVKFMMLNSNLKYVYLPEKRKLIIKYEAKRI